MADVTLNARTLNDGTLLEDIDTKLQEAACNLEEYPELRAKRTITVKITLQPDGERFVRTEASVDSKFPMPGRTGIAWKHDGVLQTSTEIREGDGNQIDLVRHIEEKTGRGF